MRDSRLCHGKSMDYLGNNKWSFERIPNVQSCLLACWLQVTADQLINYRLEEVILETECANCTISSPNGSASHNLVTIVWKESLREVQQCKLRLVETEKSYKQVIGMEKVILRLHSLTDTNAHPSKPLEEDIENIADIIRAEISGAAYSQYARN
ncbi:hypothetical protein OUZ56_005999 [Daphnia magna]|uniref:Uncharacterized protein n=1 Tax=Daphnia magna TaxID=35525 RepID=A0ABQ9YUC8_9CRUS|nr:hypothetical protein OUZ56_005999 [Daphnia magna]